MTNKQFIKETEARIIVYLANVHNNLKYVEAISNKLSINYAYVLTTLNSMHYKKWIIKHQTGRKMFYDLTTTAPLNEALATFNNDTLQKVLQQYKVEEIALNEQLEASECQSKPELDI